VVKQMAVLAGVGACLMLAGCGEDTARARLTQAFVEGGIKQGPAVCMADHMVDKLSIEQLKKLAVLRGRMGDPISALFAIRQIDDPEVVRVTIGAAAICLTGLEH
jgi:hypothetical protein